MNNIIGVKTNCYQGFSNEETFRGISQAGFKYVELSATVGCNTGISRFESFSSLCKSKQLLEKYHLIPIGLGGHTNIMEKDIKQDLINNIRLAHFFGCKYFITSVSIPKGNENIDDQIIANNIKEYIPYLEANNIILVIELHNRHNSGYKLNHLCKLVNSDLVKINYDTGNAIYCGKENVEEVYQDIEDNIDNIAYMHIKDKAGEDDEWNFPALGKGNIDFARIFKILQKHHNDCPLIVEIEFTPQPITDVQEVDKALLDSQQYINKTIK